MTVSLSVVEASDPDGLVDAAGRLGEKIGHLDTLMVQQRQALADLRANWQGRAAAVTAALGAPVPQTPPGTLGDPPRLPGRKPYGTVIHRDGVMVVMGSGNVDGLLEFTISGECRNTTDHRDDGKTAGRDVTGELLSGS